MSALIGPVVGVLFFGTILIALLTWATSAAWGGSGLRGVVAFWLALPIPVISGVAAVYLGVRYRVVWAVSLAIMAIGVILALTI